MKIGSAQSHSLCYGGTFGHGYFRTSQTRKDKRKTKEFTYNYVDRIRLAENSLQDYKCPARGSGWRHTRSISHLDLATSCRAAASGLGHWPNQRQLRHSRSLDYNQIERCPDNLDDIAEFYWRIDPDAEFYEEHESNLKQQQQSSAVIITDQKSTIEGHHHHCRGCNYADEKHHSAESINQHHSHHHQHQQPQQLRSSATAPPLQPFEYDGEACSLRRSRSLAVIREETFSDLQITSANSSRRRSQLIPRARLVNRGFFQERERFNCGNNKHHHHHHHSNEFQQTSSINGEQDIQSNGSAGVDGGGSATSCDSHQHQRKQQNNHNSSNQSHTHTHTHISHQHHHQSCDAAAAAEADNYFHNLKRLDALAAGFDTREQLHPWHNDKSDLESLNSDYFKNSLHQSHEYKQHVDFEALEQAVSLLTQDKPRIYQSRRQQPRSHIAERKQAKSECAANGADSCPENSQSSAFPETTTSNSDNDQTDSPSLSEQEYDLTKIEEIFQQAQLENDEESFELISLTTTHTHFEENTEDEDRNTDERFGLKTHSNSTEISYESGSTLKRTKAVCENLERLIAYDSVYLSSEEGSEATLVNNNCDSLDDTPDVSTSFEDESATLLHISIEDDNYESITKDSQTAHKRIQQENFESTELSTNRSQQHKLESSHQDSKEAPIYTQVLKVEQGSAQLVGGVTSSAASKPKIQAVVEKRKLKRYTTETPLVYDEGAQLGILEHLPQLNAGAANTRNCQHRQKHVASDLGYNPFAPIRRQATDSLYLSYVPKTPLGDNQYHSLPDVNIGQSLKVSECIDAELRSSYNYNRYQRADGETQRRELKPSGNNARGKHTDQRDEVVTREEIYDSIKRFGRAHQKARQREYQELLRETTSDKDQSHNGIKNATQQTAHPSTSVVEVALAANPAESLQASIAPTPTTTSSTPLTIIATAGNKRQDSDDIFAEATTAITTRDETETHGDESPFTVADVEPIVNARESCEEEAQLLHATATKDLHVYEEQPKEAPDIEVANFSKQIEQRAKEIRECSTLKPRKNQFYDIAAKKTTTTTTFSSATFRINKPKQVNAENEASNGASVTNQFRIIVTDSQNNIIEEDSIDGNCGESTSEAETLIGDKKTQPSVRRERANKETKSSIPTKSKDCSNNSGVRKKTTLGGSNSLKRKPSKSRRQLQLHQQQPHPFHICPKKSNAAGEADGECANLSAANTHTHHHQSQQESYPKSKEHRVLSTQIYKARPARVLSTNESFRKMSRPQILHVIENKRKADLVSNASSNVAANTANEIRSNQVENEYFKKVDAVRCYWSKLAKDEQHKQQEQAQILEKPEERAQSKSMQQQQTAQLNEQPKQPERRHFIIGAHEEQAPKTEAQLPTATATTTTTTAGKTTLAPNPDDFCSFMPSIEIVELGGNKTATIVSAIPEQDHSSNDGSTSPQFDHIRYKVLKSQQLLRTNMGPRTKKEAQFDGLIQYLQDYSFQELLSNNNVVIVEPVRTKVDPPTRRSAKSQDRGEKSNNATGTHLANHETDASASTANRNSKKTSGLRRHFFYQPVRVNRELYEEELPNPDTVRNVRKFFEENILPQPGQGLLVRAKGEPMEPKLTKSEHKSRRKFRHLTIDTSYGHTLQDQEQQQQPQAQASGGPARKWDTASLSSGISSGDLSSPCECNDADTKPTPDNTNTNASGKRAGSNVAIVRPQEVSGVHVQDVIRRHNSGRNESENSAVAATMSTSRSSGGGTSSVRARPRSAVVNGSTGSNGINRDIYECRIAQRQPEMAHRKPTANTHNESADNNLSARRNATYVNDVEDVALDEVDNDVDDDTADDYEDDDDDDICESHYVSNDILEKIRECGSSVTYYGGRVMHAGSPVFQRVTSPTCGVYESDNCVKPQPLPRQTKTCRVCQPNECPQNCDLKRNFQKRNAHEYAQNSAADGIKFKLVKSNSCSSRLELAGANDDYEETNGGQQTEVVRRMVNRIEYSNSMVQHEEERNHNQELVTINSQTTARRRAGEAESCMENIASQRQDCNNSTNPVTVNNHINVPLQRQATMAHDGANEKMGAYYEQLAGDNGSAMTAIIGDVPDKSKRGEEKTTDKKEMDVVAKQAQQPAAQQRSRLATEVTDEGHPCSNEAKAAAYNDGYGHAESVNSSATRKISRNKNVDLAFTLVKKQQHTSGGSKPSGSAKDSIKIPARHQAHHKIENETFVQRDKTATATATTATNINNGGPSAVTNGTKSFESNSLRCCDDVRVNIISNEIKTSATATVAVDTAATNRQLSPENENAVNAIQIATTRTQKVSTSHKPPQIVVPVQIHSATTSTTIAAVGETRQQTMAATTCSSNIDSSVVRHYVANDKSLFEKRKYDDIQFEEFEVYDPCKGFEKLIENNNAAKAIDNEDSASIDAVFNGNNDVNLTTHQRIDNTNNEERESVDDDFNVTTTDSKSKSETDCYDSLDDKHA